MVALMALITSRVKVVEKCFGLFWNLHTAKLCFGSLFLKLVVLSFLHVHLIGTVTCMYI